MVPYVSPNGRKQSVTETQAIHAARTYTLVFDSRGVVADVLYNESGSRNGLTALSMQIRMGGERTEEHAHPGPGDCPPSQCCGLMEPRSFVRHPRVDAGDWRSSGCGSSRSPYLCMAPTAARLTGG